MDPNNKFSEKIDKNRLNEQDRKKDINSKIDHFKSNPSHEEDFLNENVLFFKTKGEIIKKEDCEEDINEEILELNTISLSSLFFSFSFWSKSFSGILSSFCTFMLLFVLSLI